MFTPKYYDAIDQAQARTRAEPEDALPPFNLDELGADGWRHRAKVWLTGLLMPRILFLLRKLWPVARIGRFVIVTRATDVRDVLARPDVFHVPYGPEMRELAGGREFVLGLEGAAHCEQNKLIKTVLPDQDPFPLAALTEDSILRAAMGPTDTERVAQFSNQYATALIRNSGGRIDVMKDYITRVTTESCARYFGLQVDDPDAFAEWTMSVSAVLFADPLGDAATRQLALNGAARIRAVIDRSIDQMKKYRKDYHADIKDTVLGRLIIQQDADPRIDDATIRAILVGLVTGFIPTNTLAAGKILQELLRRPEVMTRAIKKAASARKFQETPDSGGRNPDKLALKSMLLEAARLNPALAPGQWRYTVADTKIGSVSVPKGSVVMAATMSALRDSDIDSPNQFQADRAPASADLLFGTGIHECLGKYLAISQITEAFMVLLSQPGIRRRKASLSWWGGIRWVGPFPRQLDMEFGPSITPSRQTMVTICAPLEAADRSAVERQIAELENPAGATAQAIFDATGIVHFASLSLIEAGDAKAPAPHLLLELNVDGQQEDAIQAIVAADATWNKLRPIFENTPMGKKAALAEVLRHYALDLQTHPWGAIGLNFNGTAEFSVAEIDRQDRLAEFAKKALASFLSDQGRFGNRAMQALSHVRKFIHAHPQYKAAVRLSKPEFEELLNLGAEFAEDLIVPSRRRLQVSDWKQRSKWDAFINFTRSSAFWRIAGPLVVLDLLITVAAFWAFDTGVYGLPASILLAVSGGLAATLLLVVLVVGAFLWWLDRHERRDIPDDRDPPLDHLRRIAAVENPDGFAQNHFMAVTELKSGWFRKFTLALSLWGIKHLVTNLFRPGFVLNMGTIHYARWFRLPGRDKLIFLSNYDGSWESYLEDFIMKAHQGQTAAWCNGVGFPRTRFLINGGAADGDRFKRWVRRQQVLSQFWYSRFPRLTTDQIRNNALIQFGLARASTELAAQDWLDCFGSIPRPDHAIETEEVQTLVFRGQKLFPLATFALIRFPDNEKARHQWLKGLVESLSQEEKPHQEEGQHQEEEQPEEKKRRPFAGGEITFGAYPYNADGRRRGTATSVAFSAAGLKKLGLAGTDKRDGLATFPGTFNVGMANRSRNLGDFGKSAPAEWRWADADCERQDGAKPPVADAVLIIHSDKKERIENSLSRHVEALGDKKFIIHRIDTEPADGILVYDGRRAAPVPSLDFEHFGFRDGISQPVIRGTERFSKRTHQRDVVEPGEFVLGYRNNQGYYPPTATVRAESDPESHLPTVPADVPSRFPSFEGSNSAVRDFGRNGSFLVLRQLKQDVVGFSNFIHDKAEEVRKEYKLLPNATAARVSAEWIAAKMMGRWPDGTPLILRPGSFRGEDPEKPEKPATSEKSENSKKSEKAGNTRRDEIDLNDFSYGKDDPQGLHCPFGAHIRRANPRDSMQPEDPAQQSIINRHRLLRRGRTYAYQPPNEEKMEKGLMFACLCADLDRQFEFVQQTWIGSPSFHGLRDEPDPISAWHEGPRYFTIPTASGPLRLQNMQSFVTVRAGGYFFMPSRSAIRHLADLAAAAIPAGDSHLDRPAVNEQLDPGHEARLRGGEKEGSGSDLVGVGDPAEGDVRGQPGE